VYKKTHTGGGDPISPLYSLLNGHCKQVHGEWSA